MGTRLDGWKDIAAHVGRNVRTAQRWHAQRGMPVRRVPNGERSGPGSVFALSDELDEWLASPRARGRDDEPGEAGDEPGGPPAMSAHPRSARWPLVAAFVLGTLLGQLLPCWWNPGTCGGRAGAAAPSSGAH